MWFSWLYVWVNSFSALARHLISYTVAPAWVLTAGWLIAGTYFTVINYGQIRHIYQQCWLNKKLWFAINLSVGIIWIDSFYGPAYLGASTYIFLFFSLLGIIGMASLIAKNPKTSHWLDYLSLVGVSLVVIAFIIYLFLQGMTIKKWIGLVLGFIGPIGSYFYAKQNLAFIKLTHLKGSQVLAVRVILPFLISLGLLVIDHSASGGFKENALPVFFISILSLILPVYLYQKALEQLGVQKNAIIASTVPFVTALIESVYFHHVDWPNMVVCSLYTFFTLLSYLKEAVRV